MHATSDLYNRIVANLNHWFETKVVLDGVEYNENALYSVNTNISLFGGNPEVGKAIAGEITVRLKNPIMPPMKRAQIRPYVRACVETSEGSSVSINAYGIADLSAVATLQDNIVVFDETTRTSSDIVVFLPVYDKLTSEWLPKGVFYIDTRSHSSNSNDLSTMEVHGYDAMLYAEQDYDRTQLNWPAKDTDIVNEIAGYMGVEVDPRTYTIMTEEYTLPLPTNYSFREILGYIASMYVGSFVMTDEGKLRLVSLLELPEETYYLIDEWGFVLLFGEDRIVVG